MKTAIEVANEIMAFSKPEEAKEGSVSIIFADGECSSTKAGDLLWQRTLHCFKQPTLQYTYWGRALMIELNKQMTLTYNNCKYIFTDYESGKKIEKILEDWMTCVSATDEDLSSISNASINLYSTISALEAILAPLNKRVGDLLKERQARQLKEGLVPWTAKGISVGTRLKLHYESWGGKPIRDITATVTDLKWNSNIWEVVAYFSKEENESYATLKNVVEVL